MHLDDEEAVSEASREVLAISDSLLVIATKLSDVATFGAFSVSEVGADLLIAFSSASTLVTIPGKGTTEEQEAALQAASSSIFAFRIAVRESLKNPAL